MYIQTLEVIRGVSGSYANFLVIHLMSLCVTSYQPELLTIAHITHHQVFLPNRYTLTGGRLSIC